MLIYIAGPYTGDEEANVAQAIDAAEAIWLAGFVPLVPHLSHYCHARRPHSYRIWLERGKAMLRECVAVFRMPGTSPGADEETALAEDLGIPVFHSMEELRAKAEVLW